MCVREMSILQEIYKNLEYPRSAIYIAYNRFGYNKIYEEAYNLDDEEREILMEAIEYIIYKEDSINKIIKFYYKTLPMFLRYIVLHKKAHPVSKIRAYYNYDEYIEIYKVKTPYIVVRSRKYELRTDIIGYTFSSVNTIIEIIRRRMKIIKELNVPLEIKKELVKMALEGYSFSIEKEAYIEQGSRKTSLASARSSFSIIYGDIELKENGTDCDDFGCFYSYVAKPKTPIAIIKYKTSEIYPNDVSYTRSVIILTR